MNIFHAEQQLGSYFMFNWLNYFHSKAVLVLVNHNLHSKNNQRNWKEHEIADNNNLNMFKHNSFILHIVLVTVTVLKVLQWILFLPLLFARSINNSSFSHPQISLIQFFLMFKSLWQNQRSIRMRKEFS